MGDCGEVSLKIENLTCEWGQNVYRARVYMRRAGFCRMRENILRTHEARGHRSAGVIV